MKQLPDIWLVVGKDSTGEVVRCILAGTYSESGLTVTVRRHHSGDVVGRAKGYGYDKTSTALATALTNIYGIPASDGACGESHVFTHALSHGVNVRRLSQALYDL